MAEQRQRSERINLSNRNERRFKAVAPSWILLVIVGIAGTLLAVVMYGVFERQSSRESQAALSNIADDDKKVIESRMTTYLSSMYGFKSFFESSDFVSRKDFNDYYHGLSLSERYPGFDAIGYVRRVPAEERSAFVQSVRDDQSNPELQLPDFDIKNPDPQDIYYPIEFVEPTPSDLSNFGIDLSTLPARYQAIQAAEHSRKPVASSSFKLLNNGAPGTETGFLIALPVYQRGTDTIVGFINAIFNYQHFFTNVLNSPDYAFRVTDSSRQIVYDSKGNVGSGHLLQTSRPLQVAGKTWQLELRAPSNFAQSGITRTAPYIALLASLIINILVMAIIYGLLRSRKAAIELANEITEDLRTKEQRHDLLINSIRDYAIYMLDAKGKIATWNNGAQQIKGFTADEVIGKHVSMFLPNGSRRMVKKLLDKAAANGRAEVEGWRLKKDGSRFWAGVVISAVRDTDGKLIGFVKVTRDLTERKRIENERDSFIAIAIHELKTPITSAIAYVQVLHKRLLKANEISSADIMNRVEIQLQTLAKLVSDLTDAAKIDNKRFKLNRQTCDINLLIKDLIADLQSSYKSHHLELKGHASATITCDPNRIRQVLTNLIDNAVKYSPSADRVTISISESDKDIEIGVRDYGAGIAKKDQKKIFERYYRVRNNSTVTGFGLGLFLSADIIRRHKGRLWVKQSSGDGSEIAFSLPLERKRRA